MAAKDTKVLELELRITESKIRIKDLKKDISSLDGRTLDYKKTVQKLQLEQAKLVQRQTQLNASNKQLSTSTQGIDRSTKNVIGNGKTGLTGVSAASGGAATSVLELGRVVSDAPYGIRGMANNVSQLASNMLFTAQSIDKATGKAIGFGGVISQMGKSFMGPLGILFAIQAVVAAVDFFWGSTEKSTEAVEDNTEAVNKNRKSYERLIDVVNTYNELQGLATVSLAKSGSIFKTNILSINDLVKILSRDFSEFGAGIAKLSDEDKKDPQKLKNLIDSFERLLLLREEADDFAAKISKFQKLSKEGIGTLYEEDEKGVRRLVDVNNQLISARSNYGLVLKNILNLEQEFTKEQKEGKGKKAKAPVFLGYIDEDFEARIEAYKKRYKEYTEDVRAIESEIDMANFMEQDGGSLNGQSTLITMEMNEELARVEFLIGLRKEENEGYADLEAEQTLIKKNAQLARNEIDRLEVENKRQMFNNIASILSSAGQIAGKHTAVGKGLAVASTTISTYNAAQKAYESQMQLTPDSPIRAQIAAGVAIAKGLANVKAILAVKVPNQPSVGGAPANKGRTFDFNLAGSTGQNQLAQTIGGQVAQPIKAYVVSSEITNQQQFDNQIQGAVTIG